MQRNQRYFTTNTTTSVIHFSPGASTRMACPDMSVEAGINKVLETVDNTLSIKKEISFHLIKHVWLH
jgi:heat shock protein HslJ